MQSNQKLKKRYQFVVVGYNLASLSFALELQKRGLDFCLLDSRHLGTTPFKMIPSLEREIYTRVPFNPSLDENVEKDDLSRFGEFKTIEGPALTFEKGQFKGFLGFGNNKIQALEAVETYCKTQQVFPQLSPENFWDQAIDQVADRLFLDQQVTAISIEESNVTALTLNGNKIIEGDQFYFFEHLPFLVESVGQKIKKQASQFAKAKWYSSVNLIIHHKEKPENFEEEQLYLLMGSKNQPCLGQLSSVDGSWISRWESFIPAELTIDSETTGATLKEIKKQVKRAFSPNEPISDPEQIVIQDAVYADLSKVQMGNGPVGSISNLHAYSALFTDRIGWIQEILVGKMAAGGISQELLGENFTENEPTTAEL